MGHGGTDGPIVHDFLYLYDYVLVCSKEHSQYWGLAYSCSFFMFAFGKSFLSLFPHDGLRKVFSCLRCNQ